MSKMHLCSCLISLAGDDRNQVFKSEENAVSLPEIQVLRQIHGADAVSEIKVIGDTDTDPAREKARLSAIYGSTVVDQLYPGFAPLMPMLDPMVSDDKLEATKDALQAKGKTVKRETHADVI